MALLSSLTRGVKGKNKKYVIIGLGLIGVAGVYFLGSNLLRKGGHPMWPHMPHLPFMGGGGGHPHPHSHPMMHHHPGAQAMLANAIPSPTGHAGHLPVGARITGSAGIGTGNQSFPRGRMGHKGGFGVAGFYGSAY
jgi:hypothetical protein